MSAPCFSRNTTAAGMRASTTVELRMTSFDSTLLGITSRRLSQVWSVV